MPINLPDSDSEDELPPGWEERATIDGSVYFVNHVTESTQWTHPRTSKKKVVPKDLPFGWKKELDDEGKIIFTDVENGRTTYIDPRLAFARDENVSQIDFRQRFDASSTALQILHGRDLSGKTAIVTGANCGIGFETVRTLAKHGCSVILACRNLVAAEESISNLTQESMVAAEKCMAIKLDLACFNSIRLFAIELRTKIKKIDYIILNAGVFGLPFSKTNDGYETTFQINHLSHLYLVLLLESLLLPGSRVIFVSSESHRFANFQLPSDMLTIDSLSPAQNDYSAMRAYNNSKLCNVLMAKLLAKRWKHRCISVFSLHPGNMVYSNLHRNWWLYKLVFLAVRPFTKSLQQAASTTIYCATAEELEGITGLYFNNCFRCDESKLAKEEDLANKIFSISIEELYKVTSNEVLIKYGAVLKK